MGLSPSSTSSDRNAARRHPARRTQQETRRCDGACLARYIAGKSPLTEKEFREIAKALCIDAHVLASAWASSLRLRGSGKDAVDWMVSRAYSRWRQHARIAECCVPSRPSPMAVIRAKYADRLPRKTRPLWLGFASYRRCEKKGNTAENRARFARAYEMLVDSVHGGLSSPRILRRIARMRLEQSLRELQEGIWVACLMGLPSKTSSLAFCHASRRATKSSREKTRTAPVICSTRKIVPV